MRIKPGANPSFWELFSGEPPAADESLSIGRVAILFTDLRDSTAMYQKRGDPRAYRMVRDHFAVLGECIDRNRGSLVKTIGDAVMASFASGADAARKEGHGIDLDKDGRAHRGRKLV